VDLAYLQVLRDRLYDVKLALNPATVARGIRSALLSAGSPDVLKALSVEFDQLFERMQEPHVATAVDAALRGLHAASIAPSDSPAGA